MHTSGLVLDADDDPMIAPSLPGDFAKTAYALSDKERSLLPDEVFALVLPGGLRKFACVDPGTTALSVAAFLKHGHKLPASARTDCARSLSFASTEYGLPDPLQSFKAAGLVDLALRNPLRAATVLPSAVRGTRDGIRQNLADVREGEAEARHVRGGLAAMGGMERLASANAEHMDLLGLFDSLSKTASSDPSGAQNGHHGPARAREWVPVPVSERPQVKEAQRFALPSERLYPLETYEQVKRAEAYFTEYRGQMLPEHRREYCVNLVKRAAELAIPITKEARDYGAEGYAPDHAIEAALGARRGLLETDAPERELLSKIASSVSELAPAEFCAVLSAFDKAAGFEQYYDRSVPDPYRSTYGEVKVAAPDADFSESFGGTDFVRGPELHDAAVNRRDRVCSIFGSTFADTFRKDPVATFRSLPVHQRKLLGRIARDTAL